MSRLYVHLSENIRTAESVGIRHAKAKDKLIILKLIQIKWLKMVANFTCHQIMFG